MYNSSEKSKIEFEKEVRRLSAALESNGFSVDEFLTKNELQSDKDRVMRVEAQNDFLNRERIQLEEVIRKMKADNSTKENLWSENKVLRE